jgi:aspartyl-tRNA(Asn)/glutamyl-tRNA(Gln) amidotransferase subunit C
MISKEEVLHIAKLARLELTDGEVEKMQKDLSAILDYFDLLKKAPKSKSAQILLEQKTCGDNSLRKDEILPKNPSVAQKIVAAAPDKKDDYIKVKAIM